MAPDLPPGFSELWIELDDGQSMCALINGNAGWLMYLRYAGDEGFSSRNPEYSGPEDAEIEYYLNNGQRDTYPASWALPASEVRKALEFFEIQETPPTWICWHNDSGDGVVIGDDT